MQCIIYFASADYWICLVNNLGLEKRERLSELTCRIRFVKILAFGTQPTYAVLGHLHLKMVEPSD